MSPAADGVPSENVVPKRRLDDYVTRDEHERFGSLLIERVERIERFLFEDDRDETTGEVKRRSLAAFITKADRHIDVMCDWARLVKWTSVAIATFAGAILAASKLLSAIGWPL